MTVKIIPSAEFDRQFKRLAKKYKSLLDITLLSVMN